MNMPCTYINFNFHNYSSQSITSILTIFPFSLSTFIISISLKTESYFIQKGKVIFMKTTIWGDILPAVTIDLEQGESIYTESGGMTWMSD